MTVSIDIPKQAEELLRGAFGDHLSRAVLEAIAIEGYREGKLSRFEVQTLLGLEDRWETESWLGSKGVHLDYGREDLDADRQTLDRLLGPSKP
jgi:predicted HTH domain antitoxin